MTAPGIYRIPCGDVTLSVRLEGTGPAVLLLHGLTASRATWRAVRPRLAPRCTLVLPDLAGRGASPPRRGVRYRLVDEVDRLGSLLGALGLRRIVVVGHSHGAALALGLAASRSGVVAGAVLVNPVTPRTRRPALLSVLAPGPVSRRLAALLVPPLRRPAVRWILERRVFTGRRHPEDATAEAFARPYREPARARALLRILADWNPGRLRGYLPASPVAGAVLAGSEDRRTSPTDAARLARRLDAPLAVMGGTGHAGPLERPGRVAVAVLRTVRGLRHGSAADGNGDEDRTGSEGGDWRE